MILVRAVGGMVRTCAPINPDQNVYFVARFQEKSNTWFVTGRGATWDHFAPAAGNPVQQNEDVTALRLNKAAVAPRRPNHAFIRLRTCRAP